MTIIKCKWTISLHSPIEGCVVTHRDWWNSNSKMVVRSNFFVLRMIDKWNSLPSDVVNAPMPVIFKMKLRVPLKWDERLLKNSNLNPLQFQAKAVHAHYINTFWKSQNPILFSKCLITCIPDSWKRNIIRRIALPEILYLPRQYQQKAVILTVSLTGIQSMQLKLAFFFFFC